MLCLALEDCDFFAVSVKRGEHIDGYIPQELSKNVWRVLGLHIEARGVSDVCDRRNLSRQ